MITFICMDGLGGVPSITFAELKRVLEKGGHKVLIVDVDGIETHEDRIERVTRCYREERSRSKNPIILIGQSAGGSAVRIATERLELSKEMPPDGIILMSSAMPRFIWFTTKVLAKLMAKHIWKLLFARRIILPKADISKLLEPISRNTDDLEVQVIPGKEARHLAFWPRSFRGCSCPVLLVYGDDDNWIAPSAQKKLGKMFKKKNQNVELVEVPASGHVTLFSKDRHRLILSIDNWAVALTRSTSNS